MMFRRSGCLLAAMVMVGGCVPNDRAPVGAEQPSDTGYQVSVDQTLLEEGRRGYESYCVGCHGENGDGEGTGSWALHPPPRDFTRSKFKFSSRRSGELPTDRDLFDTITRGLKGTSMPPWRLLPERERWSLVAYIKTFSARWTTDDPAASMPIAENPYAMSLDKSAAIARGEAVYHGLATCWTCHAAYLDANGINEKLAMFENAPRSEFRDDLDKPVARLSTLGDVVYVPDFHRDFVRAGRSIEVLYRSIAAGITGTAMPTWVDSIEIESAAGDGHLSTRGDLWALAYYVQDLIAQRPALLAQGSFRVRDRGMDVTKERWEPVVGDALRAESGGGDDEEEEEEEE